MASSSSSPSTAPVSSSQSWSYDVFLSFRGEDTRKRFVDHLYTALDQNGIYTYKDDVTLPRGESISPALLKAIEESQIAVIIFSKNYANSAWCLNELKHIMKCRDSRRQTVMPIFYDVEPREVGKQKGTYKKAFVKHELENKEKIKSWRKALKKASKISGWETKQIANGHEAQGIKQIVDKILQTLSTSRANAKLVGMRKRVQSLKSKLQMEAGGVCMIGIWGVGGGGKTTLASSIYDDISSMYDGSCFVNNIREKSLSKINGLEKLQGKMLSGILKQKQVQKVRRVEEGRGMIKARLGHKKVLIVLDDVDKHDQLEALVGSRDWFGEGSRIIITTRDEHILNRVDVIHPIRLLEHGEAGILFRKHAHRDHTPMKDFEKLSEEVVSYAGGLPLALTVLGAFLCGRDIGQWRSALDRLKEIPDKDIIGKLRIGFDGLEQVEKNLFLDIACLFRWKDTNKAMKLLEACGFHPVIGVEVLRQKALIIIDEDGRFDMHDLVQEMGHYIVRGDHLKNPEKHSRVWKRDDVRRILAMDPKTELDNIEAIDFQGFVSYEESQRFLQLAGNMNKLRWIDLRAHQRWNNEQRDETILPLPVNFPPRGLCSLVILGSIPQKQLWEGYKYLPNLRHMELVDMPNLIKIPDFAALPNLETFKLYGCPCLEEIHPSIGHLKMLVSLSIQLCPLLRMYPSITRIKKLETLVFTGCNKLETIPEIQQHMENLPNLHLDNRGLRFLHSALRKLDLSDCCLGDEEIGSGFWELPNLEELNLSGNTFSRLDFSILRLHRLKWLNVSGCYRLVELSELPSSISVVIADICHSLESFGDISNCNWLWNVSLKGWNNIDQLHGDTLIQSMLKGNSIEDHFISVALPYQFEIEDQFAIGFVGMLFREKRFRLHLPDDWYNDFCGFLICIVTDATRPCINIIVEHEDPPFDLSQESDEVVEAVCGETMTCLAYVSFSSLRHTTLLTSSYNIISFTMKDMDILTNGKSTYVATKLIPRKSKSDEVQTTDSSEFWDKQSQDADLNTFTIQQCDSESSIEILWKPCYSNR